MNSAARTLLSLFLMAGCTDDDLGGLRPRPAQNLGPQCFEQPLPVCSGDSPCDHEGDTVTTASREPDCGVDGAPGLLTNPLGDMRWYCHYKPSGDDERPLVIFLHPEGGRAEDIYEQTSLRLRATNFSMQSSVGFHLVSLQARNVNLATLPRLSAPSFFDFLWWDLNAPSTNPDIRDLDQLIQRLVLNHAIDPERIYLMGWGAGGSLAQLYGMSRHQISSPQGYRVAAVVAYSSGGPFVYRDSEGELCQRDLLVQSNLPLRIYSRSCDLAPCNVEQRDALWDLGNHLGFGATDTWFDKLQGDIGNVNAEWRILADDGSEIGACQSASNCSLGQAEINYLNWPEDLEPEMLNFLNNFSRP